MVLTCLSHDIVYGVQLQCRMTISPTNRLEQHDRLYLLYTVQLRDTSGDTPNSDNMHECALEPKSKMRAMTSSGTLRARKHNSISDFEILS